MVRTGADYIASLRDGRAVYYDGARIDDVTAHPAFRNAVGSVAGLYDMQAAPANLERQTFISPTSGARVGRMWQLPRSYGELVERREALTAVAEATCGMIGRSPDHVASVLGGMVMGIEVFEAYDPERARALLDYYAYARDRDLYLSYVIINPQADRSKTASAQPDRDLVAHIRDEDGEGITIQGAKMLGTGTILSDEIMVAGFQVYQEGDERYAFTAMVPAAAEGVKILSRKSYEAAADSIFDHPLASRFDENDAVVYFDAVKIPWERVFMLRDIPMAHAQWHETRAHVFQNYQCQIRFMVKLRFLLGLARRIAEANGIIAYPQVRETLGHLAAQVGMIEGLVKGMEAGGEAYHGYFVPDRRLLCSAQVLSQQLYPDVVMAIRKLAGGGVIMLPSSHRDFANPEIADLIGRTQKSPVLEPVERVKLFKLAWDALGSEFGSRHLQYEMFYSGPTVVTCGHAFRNYDWDNVTGMVDGFMAGYGLDGGVEQP